MEIEQHQEEFEDIKTAWSHLTFEGKEHFRVNDKNELLLIAPQHPTGRKLATFQKENFKTVFDELKRHFTDVQNQFNALKEKWEQQEDKLSLLSQVKHFENYVSTVNAVGDFSSIWQELAPMQQALKAQLSANYETRMAIVQKAEELKHHTEIHTEEWNVLLDQWKSAPYIEKTESDQLWQRFDKARNAFFENKKIFAEERNKELMQNLDLKLEICEQAEKWAQSEKWHEASETFKSLFEKWKSIGHVPSVAKNDELWERFRTAKANFFERRTHHFEEINKEQEENYQLKSKLVEEAEILMQQTSWKETSLAMDALMEKWKNIGKVPFEKSEELWQRLQSARNNFYNARRENRNEINKVLEANLAIKENLIKQAESLKQSTDWAKVTNELNYLLAEWKKTGAVPKEKREDVWNRFLAARKYFFNRKDADREKRKATYSKRINGRLEQTQQFLAKIRAAYEEDKFNLEDFQKSLDSTTGDSVKDVELRAHLEGLISDLKRRLPSKEQKIKDVEAQLSKLTEAEKKLEEEKHQNNGIRRAANDTAADNKTTDFTSTENNDSKEERGNTIVE